MTIRVLLGTILLIPAAIYSQPEARNLKIRASLHQETPDQPYMPTSGSERTPSPRIKTAGYTMVQVNVDANGNNIVGDAANEPSMIINPTNSQHITIGWRQFDNVQSNFRQAGYAYTGDGGLTWTFPGVINPGIFRSDPVLDADINGFVYYNSLTSNSGYYTCKVFKSDNGGSSWDGGTDAHGGDKQWMVIDRSGGAGTGNIYCDWNAIFSSCYPGSFTRSTNTGTSYENCTDLPGNPFWGTLAVGNNGELYISGWSNDYSSFVVLKSTNAQDPLATPTWSVSIPNLDGVLVYGELINPVGLTGQASIAVDQSSGPSRDNVYLLASVQRFSNSDSADVMFTRSTDGGFSWSTPVKVNDNPGTDSYQWFGTMSVAPNGRIDATWLDTRESSPGGLLSALYYSYSLDQGTTWSGNVKLSPLFDSRVGWPQQAKMGDYVSMASDNDKAYLTWSNTLNGEQDVYFSTITPGTTGIGDLQTQTHQATVSAFPNPFKENSTIIVSLAESCFVRVTLLDVCGKPVKTLLESELKQGNHKIDMTGQELSSGYYFVHVLAGSQTYTTRLVKVD